MQQNLVSIKKVRERSPWPKLNAKEKRRKMSRTSLPVISTGCLGSLEVYT